MDDRKRLIKCKAIVGTLGRLLHLIKNNVIRMQYVKTVVLDEADKLIGSDFRKDINKLFSELNKNRQVIACSATYADGLDKLLFSYMQNPIAVSATREVPILIGIKQFLYEIEDLIESNETTSPPIKVMLRKLEAVQNVLKKISFKQCIIFSNSQMRAESFYNYLTKNDWTVDLILGSQEQHLRSSTFHKFRNYQSRILIGSDLIARGIDVENVNLVINLDVPADSSTYLHRIGRCGRFGTHGIAITLSSDSMETVKFQKLLSDIGGKQVNVLRFPAADKLDDSQIWDFTNRSNDGKLCGEIIGFVDNSKSITPGEKLNSFLETESITADKKIENTDSTERKNIELLEISRLLLGTKSSESIKVDLNLFSDYPDEIKEITKNANENGINDEKTFTSEINIAMDIPKGSEVKFDDIFDSFSDFNQNNMKNVTEGITATEVKMVDNSDFLNAMKNLNTKFTNPEISITDARKYNVSTHSDSESSESKSIECESKSVECESNSSDEKSGNESDDEEDNILSSDQPQIIEYSPIKTKDKIWSKKQSPTKPTKNQTKTSYWEQLYWQQINQINRYVEFAKGDRYN